MWKHEGTVGVERCHGSYCEMISMKCEQKICHTVEGKVLGMLMAK
jgi:hypothetical protein